MAVDRRYRIWNRIVLNLDAREDCDHGCVERDLLRDPLARDIPAAMMKTMIVIQTIA